MEFNASLATSRSYNKRSPDVDRRQHERQFSKPLKAGCPDNPGAERWDRADAFSAMLSQALPDPPTTDLVEQKARQRRHWGNLYGATSNLSSRNPVVKS
jgi:hypothetical protein